jgi:hypothetical protein
MTEPQARASMWRASSGVAAGDPEGTESWAAVRRTVGQ